jgi:hypothetical protein
VLLQKNRIFSNNAIIDSHADNCMMGKDAILLEQYPEQTYRVYGETFKGSAILLSYSIRPAVCRSSTLVVASRRETTRCTPSLADAGSGWRPDESREPMRSAAQRDAGCLGKILLLKSCERLLHETTGAMRHEKSNIQYTANATEHHRALFVPPRPFSIRESWMLVHL